MLKKIINFRFIRQFSISAMTTLALASCNNNEATPSQTYDDGVFVINAGNFFDNNGTLSFIDRNSKVASTDIFMKENTRSLAGGLTDYTEADGKGIILVDNSTDGKDAIEIVDAHTFKSLASIKGEIENPRKAIRVSSNKVYITCWDTFNTDNIVYSYKLGYIAVLDLNLNKIIKKIPVDKGAESMLLIGNNVYVGNVGDQKTIKVINIQKDEVSESITAGTNPNYFVLDDATNKIWLTIGNEIALLNPSTKTIEKKIKAGNHANKLPSNLCLSADKKTLYYNYNFYDAAANYQLKGEINAIDIASGISKVLINRTFNGAGFDEESNLIYTSYIPSYKQASYVYRFQPSGILVDSIKTEIAPTGFFFK